MGTNLFFLSSLSSKLFETRESWISWEKLFVFDLNDLHMAPFLVSEEERGRGAFV
jgi:hypothetical protein